MPFECTVHCQLQSDMENEAVFNNTMVSQFYVFFNFLYGKSVLHKRTAREKCGKSWFIPYLHSFWYLEMNQLQKYAKKKLVKSFRKLIFPLAKGQTTLRKSSFDNIKHLPV